MLSSKKKKQFKINKPKQQTNNNFKENCIY